MKAHGDTILQRLERRAVDLSRLGYQDAEGVVFEECKYAGVDKDGNLVRQPRWRVDAKWIEFECGCRAEREMNLKGMKSWDPVIFVGLPEQAVYDFVCQTHGAAMNVRCSFGGFKDFDQWRRHRRRQLMGRTL